MRLTTLVQPISEPVLSDDVKENILIRTDDDDAFIDRTITVVRQMIEDYAHISIMPQTKQCVLKRHEFRHDPHPELYFFIYPVPGSYRTYLPRPPINEITQVDQTSLSEDGTTLTTITLDPSYYYLEGEEIVLNIDNIDPTVRYFTITYTTGYDSADDVPQQLKQAIIQAASDHYDNRTSFVLSADAKDLASCFRRQRLLPANGGGSGGGLSDYNRYY
jgi:uncharacterized phiE125 gp8 family phage protein